jgi:uncharacterized protein DUF5666
MKLRPNLFVVAFLAAVLGVSGASTRAAALIYPAAAQESGGNAGQGPNDQRMPLFGKITAVHDGSITIINANGENVTVKLTGKTEFRKDRQDAKRTDFKVGDLVIVRGQENPDHSWTAEVVGGRSGNGPGGPGGREGREGRGGPGGSDRGFGGQGGTLGKDFVAGEITAIDAPKLSVLRSDKVTQSIELNEDTSLRKGRDSITMADVQVGDHVFARGGLENNVFVPKMVMVISPEQWKRMQEWTGQAEGQRRQPSSSAGAAVAPSQKPPEPQH